MNWQKMESAPKDGEEIIILFDAATVDIIRLCFWNDGEWWSYRNSVTQEAICEKSMNPVAWIEFDTSKLKCDGFRYIV